MVSLVVYLVSWCLLLWARRYQERHPEQTRKHTALVLGLAAGLIIAALLMAAPNLKFELPKPPVPPKKDDPPGGGLSPEPPPPGLIPADEKAAPPAATLV